MVSLERCVNTFLKKKKRHNKDDITNKGDIRYHNFSQNDLGIYAMRLMYDLQLFTLKSSRYISLALKSSQTSLAISEHKKVTALITYT